jgi:tRNA U34 2-thiouridine synthase MnmA/TrmU
MDKLEIHHRLCQGYAPRVSTGTVKIPSTHNLLKAEHKPLQARPQADHSVRNPSGVVCYICGKKYGSHSITIHEPQCLKKFNIQNNKLPVGERLPLPKKRSSVARVLLREEEVLVVARNPGAMDPQGEVESKEEQVQRYLENCYSEFERELIPCKRCRRTFTPARHRMHETNCNAKPLKLL